MIMIEFLQIRTGVLFWRFLFVLMIIIDRVGMFILISWLIRMYHDYDAAVQKHERKRSSSRQNARNGS